MGSETDFPSADGSLALLDVGSLDPAMPTTSTASKSVVVAVIPSSGGTYVIKRCTYELPDGRILLCQDVWFYNQMHNFLGLPATQIHVKRRQIPVDPEDLQEAQARYDKVLISQVEGFRTTDTLEDFTKALEQTREAAQQEAKDLVVGGAIGKLRRLGRLSPIADKADDAGDALRKAPAKIIEEHHQLPKEFVEKFTKAG